MDTLAHAQDGGASQAWVAVVLYFYAIIKDYGSGSTVRENTWYSPLATQAGDDSLGLAGRIRSRVPQPPSAEDRAL